MSRGPRSARLVVGHERGRVYGTRRPEPAAPAVGRYAWPEADQAPTLPLPPPLVGPPPPWAPLTTAQRRALRRRVWSWRLLLGGWLAVTVLVLYLGVRWLGVASACCHLVTVAVLFGLAWCASVDVRELERDLRNGRR
ncbi:hypothetical protein EF879_23590 [Micromonospora sp. HM5-17]|nr:hypothetical protein EF879_23590 [Micromonospora sp. HM5-17]